MRMKRLVVPGLLVMTTAACGRSADARSDTLAVRDSAGVQIVESNGPAWGEGEGWRLEAAPVLEIGMEDGEPEYLLSGVRSALRRPDGSVVLANSSTAEIRIYDGEGRHLRSAGGKGAGPGEFTAIQHLQIGPGDSLLAFDYIGRRVSIFSQEGAFARSYTLQTEGSGFPQPVGALSDGSWITRLMDLQAGEGDEDSQQVPIVFLHFSPTGELLDTVGTPVQSTFIMKRRESSDGYVAIFLLQPIFAPEPVAATVGENVAFGTNGSFAVQLLAPDGTVRRINRVASPPRPVTDEMVAAFRRARMDAATTPEARQREEENYRDLPHAPTLPFYRTFLGDEEGNLWMEDYPLPDEKWPAWGVFDAEGRFLGRVQLPENFRPMHIGAEFVTGVVRDELDVERVRVYRMIKP